MYIYVNDNDAEKIVNLAKDNEIEIETNINIHKELMTSEFFDILKALQDDYYDDFGENFPNIDMNNNDHIEQFLNMVYDDYLESDFFTYNEDLEDLVISCLKKFML